MTRTILTAGTAAAILLCSCAKMTIQRGGTLREGNITVVTANSFLWGLVRGPHLPIAQEMCNGANLNSLIFAMSPTDVLLTSITVGIYVPHRVTYVCAKAQ